LPISQWCPKGSTIRPTRQPYSLSLIDQTSIGQTMTGQTTVAPALTARAKAASGSATTTTIRTVAPPRNSAPSDSGLKFLCSGERGPQAARFSPDGVQTHPRPKIQIPPPTAGRPPLHSRSRCGTIRQLQTGVPRRRGFRRMGWKRRLVELDRLRPVSNREHWGDRGFLVLGALRLVSHGGFLSCLSISPAGTRLLPGGSFTL
jgi:hypothetical protein